MFEDLVLQSITYEGDTIKLTVPDYLPESQRWNISISYWEEADTELTNTNIKGINITEPGEYVYSDINLLGSIYIRINPKDATSVTSAISISYLKGISFERLEVPTVSFNNIYGYDFEWIQGQGYKDYVKDYTGEFSYEIDW